MDLSSINIDSIGVGEVICRDINNLGWTVVRSVLVNDELSQTLNDIVSDKKWEAMEQNSMRRQKFNINSSGILLDKWKSDPGILDYISLVKLHVININLPNGKIYNYDVGGRNILSNLGPIHYDQWPHYDYSNPNIKTNHIFI